MLRRSTALLMTLLFATGAAAEDPFALGVRNTPHRTPEEEQKLFKLPPGFEIQLVAAEPQIQKPLNMAFDARGRLWVTDTIEYPYAAPLDKPGRDSIKILEDTNNDGRADKITTFVDGLNIPIGLLPYKNGVIAHSIPNIWYFEDTDGDDKCDKRTVLYGPFDHTRDTHGMENAFRRGFDGWIYACHGFNNDSHVKGADGHEVHLNSGNTFRFRPDGSRIEHYTHGQVNPFGMCFDPLFNIFTADCHSKPITQLLRGGYYESFGKPHDGLGYVPPMMDHLHGSTAICGLVWVDGENFPPEYRGQFLSGNVMTSRINRNSPVYHGSTIRCKEEPDFLSTDDPWFRPVDLQIGPDGALYIADFYNRIIGHYEVPLPHPGRDRTSGRIWRVVYKGDDKNTKPAERQKDLTKASVEEMIAELDHPVLGQRLLAADELVNRVGKDSLPELEAVFSNFRSARQASHLLWVMSRLDESRIEQLGKRDLKAFERAYDDEGFRVHLAKAIAAFDMKSLAALGMFNDFELTPKITGFVPRAAVDAAAVRRKDFKPVPTIGILLSGLKKVPADDTHLIYVVRKAVRDFLADVKDISDLEEALELHRSELAQIALALPSSKSADLLIIALRDDDEPQTQQLAYLTHAARYAEGEGVGKLEEIVRERWADDLDLQLKALLALQQGLAQRGQAVDSLIPWAEELGAKLLAQSDDDVIAWEDVPVPGKPRDGEAWFWRQYNSADGKNDQIFYSSLVKGEGRTGIYRSLPFELPEKFSFWCAGHVGLPPKVLDFNYIRLRDAANGEILAEVRPPRNDTAQRFEWDLAEHRGKRGYVELVDADNGGAYAWLAVGRFSVAGLNPNQLAQRQQAVAQLAAQLKLKKLKPQLLKLLTATSIDGTTRSAAAQAITSFQPDARSQALVRVIDDKEVNLALRQQCATALATEDAAQVAATLADVMQIVPNRVQTAVAETLAGDAIGAKELLRLVEHGKASAALLRTPNVKQKLASLKLPDLEKQAEELTSRLPPANELIDKLIAERRAAYDKAQPNAERGAEVFAKNCASCHQIAGKGQIVGPQLDGIGQRGLDRVLEDVLDPNRNVDVAFRTSTLALADGRVISGLVRREEGAQLVVVDNQGKELRINKDDVEERVPTSLSLMPANVAEIVSPDDFQHLVAYLLQQKAKPKE